MTKRLHSVLIALLIFVMVVSSIGGAVSASGSAQQAQLAVPIMVVNTSFLNIRTGPGAQYTVLVTVVGGTELPVLGVADDGVWYYVATPVGNGWLNVDYVLPRGDFRYVPLIDPVVAAPPVVIPFTPVTIGLPTQPGVVVVPGQGGAVSPFGTVERFRAMINVEAVDLLTAPREGASVLTTLIRDDSRDFPIVGRSRDPRGFDWIAINVPDVGSGWVQAPKLVIRLSARYRDVLTIIGDAVRLNRNLTGQQTEIVLLRGSEAYLIDISRDGQFIQVETPEGVVGWIPFHAAVTRQGTTTDDLGDVPDDIVVLPQGVVVVGDQGGAVAPGFFLPAPAQAISSAMAIVNTGNLHARSGPGGHFTSVAVLPGGTETAVIGMVPDQMWYLVQGAFGQGWIDSDFVLIRGNLDPIPVIEYDVAGGTAAIAMPVAVVATSLPLYAAPATNFGQVGVLVGPTEASVVARTADFGWVQLSTPFGFGWVPAGQVVLRGDASLIPIV